ncbi:hypothetical protein [Vibrio agarivorans]|uniref:hypothetical protein n=1 Tax=Vibrio agarivorans TaxID=153622 RepID=UPI0025B40723|nr:hypothetical protein [Vibrio agarivorans]MDN3659957.1 hypothetical protein [Vibrio agarivorans]
MATRGVNNALNNLSRIAASQNPMQGLNQAGKNINQAVQGLRDMAREQTDIAQQNYETGVAQNTSQAVARLNQLAAEAAQGDGQLDVEAFRQDLAQYGNQIDLDRVNAAELQATNNTINQWRFNQEQQQVGAQSAATEYVSNLELPETVANLPDNAKLNYVRTQLRNDETMSPQAKEVALQQYTTQLEVDRGLRPQWSDPVTQTYGDSQVMTQTNNVTGETKQVGAWSVPGLNGTGADVFATDIKYRDGEGNLLNGSKGKDGRVYDRNGQVVEMGEDFEEVQPTMVDFHSEVLANQQDYSAEQVAASREFLNAESALASNRGQYSQSQFVDYVTERNNIQSDIQFLDESLEIISLLQESDSSRFGNSLRQLLNKYAEPLGMQFGDAEVNDLYAQSESRKLEVVRSIVRAFAPVSDTAMSLTIDSLSGNTLAEQLQTVKATRDNIASGHNSLVKTAEELDVAEAHLAPDIPNWTKPQYESKAEVEQKTNEAIGNAEATAADLQSRAANGGQPQQQPEPVGAQITAPQGALDYLTANPDQIDAFEAKYGYRPEGF